jgi:hypothetical protein
MTAEDVGASMSSEELTAWSAFERVYGPVLIHERIDVGLAQVGFILAKLMGRGHPRPRDFLPGWYTERASESSVLEGFQALMRMAQNGGGDADH